MLQNVQPDFNVTDTSSDAYIKNKPNLSVYATKSEITNYLCLKATTANSTVRIDKHDNEMNPIPSTLNLEYSTDKETWTEYTWSGETGTTITLDNGGKVYFRGENEYLGRGAISYIYFVMTGGFEATGNVISLLSKTCSKFDLSSAFCRLFLNCTVLTKADIFPAKLGTVTGLEGTFAGCTGLTSIEFPEMTISGNYVLGGVCNGCTSLSRIKIGIHSWGSQGNIQSWFNNVAANGVFICPTDLDASSSQSKIPSGWAIERTSSATPDWSETTATDPAYVKNRYISTETDVSSSTYTVNAGQATTPVIAVSSSLTLSAGTVASGKIAYAEVVIDLQSGATVTAGTGITLVDTPTAEKRNVCVARWQDGACKLYVVITEDLPVDESSSSI